MISSLAGQVKHQTTNTLVIDISGVGILVNVPARILAVIKSGSMIELHTHLIVREDALTLYGFDEITDRNFFELLLSVTGIGPKVAQAILNINEAAIIAIAIKKSDLKVLEAIPGLGKKGAQRLVLELKDKVDNYLKDGVSNSTDLKDQVENALQGLGYSAKESKEITLQIKDQIQDPALDLAKLIKIALQSSGTRK
jgi:Holliday junction DNA helicase RuvA